MKIPLKKIYKLLMFVPLILGSGSLFAQQLGSGAFHDVVEIKCVSPYYNLDGTVNYSAKIEIFNNISTTSDLVINNTSAISITSPPGIILTNFNDCSSNSIGIVGPISIAPGGSVILCFNFTAPINAGGIVSRVDAIMRDNGLAQVSNDEESLPSCICDVCDNWEITPSNQSFWPFSSNDNSNMRMGTSFQLFNADPIQQVKAEIISVEHEVNDEQCYTCTQHDVQMGLFYSGANSGIINGSGWRSNGRGTLFDDNEDNYGNEFTWNASTPQGVDFSARIRSVSMDLNLPKTSTLASCERIFKVCVRYTFTDINCQACDTVICYRYEGSEDDSTNDPFIDGIRNKGKTDKKVKRSKQRKAYLIEHNPEP